MNRFLDRIALKFTWRDVLAYTGLFFAIKLAPNWYGYLVGMAWLTALYLIPGESRRRCVAALRDLPATYRAGWQGTKFRRKRSAREEHDESR